MLSLGDVHIRREELSRITGRGRKLRLVLDWPQTDLPVLLDLPPQTELRFQHLAGDRVGAPVQLDGWSTRRQEKAEHLTVVLDLTFVYDDEGPPGTP